VRRVKHKGLQFYVQIPVPIQETVAALASCANCVRNLGSS